MKLGRPLISILIGIYLVWIPFDHFTIDALISVFQTIVSLVSNNQDFINSINSADINFQLSLRFMGFLSLLSGAIGVLLQFKRDKTVNS